VVALAKDVDMQIKWRYFLKTIKDRELPFEDVINKIEKFLRPVWDAIVSENELIDIWNPSNGWNHSNITFPK
jgi:2-hydroxy-3-keto-5-methylthiopentenyl-1-phosphate phosphatase